MTDIFSMIYTYFTDLLKLWLILWGIMNFSVVKKKRVYLVTGFILAAILTYSGLQYTNNRDLAVVINTVAVIFIISLILEGNFFKKFAYSLLAYVITLVLDSSVIGIGSLIMNMSSIEYLGESIPRYITDTFNVATIGLVVLINKIGKKSNSTIKLSKKIYALLFAGAGTGFTTLAALLVSSNDKATDQARKVMVIVTIIVVIAYLAACIMIIFITESRDNYKALSLISQNIIETQQQYYGLVSEKQQEMRSIRHEIKNHLACIYGLYQSGKLEEMDQYINQLIEASNSSEELFETGNDIVNAILNDAHRRYKKEGIVLRLEGCFPMDLKIAPMDLCVIFANTVTNAVEAILRMDRIGGELGYIDIRIRSFKEDLYIDISNPIGNIPEIINGKLTSSKRDRSLHGFGVKNVIQCVEKYGGNFQYKHDKQRFTVEINLTNRI